MDDAQIWVMIGAVTSLLLGMLTVVSTLFVRVVRAEVGSIRGRLDGLEGQLGGLRHEISTHVGGLRSEMSARFDAVNTRIDGLDRDVQAVVKRTFGLDRD